MPHLRTAVADAHELDGAGLVAVLERYPHRVRVVSGADDAEVVLYGVREHDPGHDDELHELVRSTSATVVVLGWDPEAPQVAWAISCGADGAVSKTLQGEDLVTSVERIHAARGEGPRLLPSPGECHPALRSVGLTPREVEVLTLIAQGLTNQEIADLAFLSINSVKTYVRTAYRKIGVSRRSQAVSWGLRAGLFAERPERDDAEADLNPTA